MFSGGLGARESAGGAWGFSPTNWHPLRIALQGWTFWLVGSAFFRGLKATAPPRFAQRQGFAQRRGFARRRGFVAPRNRAAPCKRSVIDYPGDEIRVQKAAGDDGVRSKGTRPLAALHHLRSAHRARSTDALQVLPRPGTSAQAIQHRCPSPHRTPATTPRLPVSSGHVWWSGVEASARVGLKRSAIDSAVTVSRRMLESPSR